MSTRPPTSPSLLGVLSWGVAALALLTLLARGGWADRVTEQDGSVVEGTIRYQQRHVEVALPGGGSRRIPYDRIASIEDGPDGQDLPVEVTDRRALEQLVEERASAAAGDADQLCELALLAWQLGFHTLGEELVHEAVEADPGHETAHGLLGEVRDGDGWASAAPEVLERLADCGATWLGPGEPRCEGQWTLNPTTHPGMWQIEAGMARDLARVARWCRDRSLPRLESWLLRGALVADAFCSQALEPMMEIYEGTRPRTPMRFPLRGRWLASNDPTHHHQLKKFALFALDFLMVNEEGEHYRGSVRRVRNHYAWDQPVYAVADGTVIVVLDDFADNDIGEVANWESANLIVIRHDIGEHSLYVHLKRHTATVAVGDRVVAGQEIGRVGNSGASGQPHLHFAIADQDVISFPFYFRDYTLVADGNEVPVRIGRPREGQTFIIDPDD